MSFISIQVLRPAQMPLPADAKRILIVNNAVPQPNNYGLTVFSFGTKVKTKAVANDSLAFYYVQELLKRFNSTKGRQYSLLYLDAGKRKTYLDESPISRYSLQNIADTTTADCIISLDKLLINSVMRSENYLGACRLTMDSQIWPTLRIYSADELQRPKVIRSQDSLYWEVYHSSVNGAAAAFPSMNLCYKDLIAYNIDKITQQLLPSVEKVSRFYYYGNDINLREAARYVSLERWDDAAEIWKYVYSVEKSKKKKAYSAANLALYNELNDNFDKAIEWAQVAEKHFLSSGKTQMRYEAERITTYISELSLRKEEATQLDKQLP